MAIETVSQSKPPGSTPAPMTYEEFLGWDGGNEHVEWVNGKVVFMSPISREHSDVGLFLLTLMRTYVEARDLGTVLHDPFQMKTGAELPGRAPDILFVAKANLPRLKRLYLEGPGDLVVEIISPGSRATDRGEKFHEYEQGGVPELWLIDPQRRQAEFHLLGTDGIYHCALTGRTGRFESRALPGLWIETAWLWQCPLPSTLGILREWKII